MPRGNRIHVEGGFYHAIVRGNYGQAVFKDDEWKRSFLIELSATFQEFQAKIHAYAVLDNHAHFLAEAGNLQLGWLFKAACQAQALRFNQALQKRGRAFQDRPKIYPCTNDAYLLNAARYIERNPVEAGIVDSPEKYEFSSCRAFLGIPDGITDTERILSFFGGSRGPIAGYRAFVGAKAPARWPHKRFKEWVPEDDLPEADARPAPSADLHDIAARVAMSFGISVEALKGFSRDGVLMATRRAFVSSAIAHGHAAAHAAAFLGRTRGAISSLMKRK